MSLLVPTSIAAEAENAARNQAAEAAIADAERWTEELKRIDYHLSVVWIGEQTPKGYDGLVPGRWHIKKAIPGASDEYFALVGPAGEYREPGGWMLDLLNENDMWNPRVHRNRKEAREKLRDAKKRAIALETEQRRDEMALGARAAMRMRGDSGMHQRTDLKRDKPKEKKLILPNDV